MQEPRSTAIQVGLRYDGFISAGRSPALAADLQLRPESPSHVSHGRSRGQTGLQKLPHSQYICGDAAPPRTLDVRLKNVLMGLPILVWKQANEAGPPDHVGVASHLKSGIVPGAEVFRAADVVASPKIPFAEPSDSIARRARDDDDA